VKGEVVDEGALTSVGKKIKKGPKKKEWGTQTCVLTKVPAYATRVGPP